MNRIETFLESYGLSLSECHIDWQDMVEEYNSIKSALPSAVREQKENAIISAFNNFHEIIVEEPEKQPVKKAPRNPKKQVVVVDHDISSEILNKADDMLKHMS